MDHFVSHIFEISRKNGITSITNYTSSHNFNLTVESSLSQPKSTRPTSLNFNFCTQNIWYSSKTEDPGGFWCHQPTRGRPREYSQVSNKSARVLTCFEFFAPSWSHFFHPDRLLVFDILPHPACLFHTCSFINSSRFVTQCAQGMYYYKKMVHEKFILFGQIWVHIIDLSHKWASSRVEVHKIIFFQFFLPILALLSNNMTFFMELLKTKLSQICQMHLIFAFK